MTTDIQPEEATPKQTRRSLGSMLGAILFAVQPIVMNVISVPVMVYIIRRLGATGYGQWATASGLIMTVGALTSMGLRGAFVRAVARDPDMAAELTAEQMGLRALLGTIAAILGVMIALAIRYSDVVIWCTLITGMGMILSGVAATSTDLFQATNRLPIVAGIGMSQGLAVTFASALAVWAGAGPIGLAIAYLFGPITWLSVSVYIIQRNDFPVRLRWNLTRFWHHIKSARFLAAQQIISAVGRNAEALMAPRFIGMTQYGLFSAGTMLSDRMVAVPDGLSTALYPIVASTHARNPDQASHEVASFLTLTLALCLPICIMSMFVAGPIAMVLFPLEVAQCSQIIRITIWALPLLSIDMIINYSLNAAGREITQTRTVMIANVLTLVASLLLIWWFGLLGACFSWILRHPICISLRMTEFRRSFRKWYVDIPIVRLAVCNLLLAGMLWVIHPWLWSLIPEVGIGRTGLSMLRILAMLVFEGAVGISVYGSMAIVFRVFGDAELGAIWRRVVRKFTPGS